MDIKTHTAPYVATLPCETLMSAKQAINVQGSVMGLLITKLRKIYC